MAGPGTVAGRGLALEHRAGVHTACKKQMGRESDSTAGPRGAAGLGGTGSLGPVPPVELRRPGPLSSINAEPRSRLSLPGRWLSDFGLQTRPLVGLLGPPGLPTRAVVPQAWMGPENLHFYQCFDDADAAGLRAAFWESSLQTHTQTLAPEAGKDETNSRQELPRRREELANAFLTHSPIRVLLGLPEAPGAPPIHRLPAFTPL